jgi:hypothetical protein
MSFWDDIHPPVEYGFEWGSFFVSIISVTLFLTLAMGDIL